MICERIKPNWAISHYIREYVLIDLSFDNRMTLPVKAYPTNPEEGISFQIKGRVLADKPESNFSELRAKTCVFGQPDSRQNISITHEFMLVCVRFQPGALFQLLKIPMNELLGKTIDAELILGTDIKEVSEKLANAPDYRSIPPILDAFFISRIKQIKYDVQPIDKIGQLIMNNPQGFNLSKIANAACLSTRQFERRFVQQIGLSPKYYARICRFYQAYILKEVRPNLDWQRVAYSTGYTDYQHLVKDFKHFAGTSPNSLMQEALQNPERRLNIAPNFVGV